jgi:hypothetical protein
MSEIDRILALGKTLPDIEEAKEHPELITPEVVETLNQMGEGIGKVGQVLTDWFFQAYLEDGAKYGETPEGMT